MVDKTLNELLVNLFNDIMEIEGKCLISGEFSDITNNDMHIIEAIGIGEPQKSSVVAEKMSITKGTLTKAIDGLVNKGYVERIRGQADKRIITLSLTEKGQKAYFHHELFHKQMIEKVKQDLDEEEMKVLIKLLAKLADYFKTLYSEEKA